MRRPGDDRLVHTLLRWWRLGLGLMKYRRAQPRRRVFQGHKDSQKHEKHDDQQINFLRALTFCSPEGIEVMFVQTHKLSTMETYRFTWPGRYPFLNRHARKTYKVCSTKKDECHGRPETAQTGDQVQHRLVDFPFVLLMNCMPTMFHFDFGLQRAIVLIRSNFHDARAYRTSSNLVGSLACKCKPNNQNRL